jgi:hypothetical protein
MKCGSLLQNLLTRLRLLRCMLHGVCICLCTATHLQQKQDKLQLLKPINALYSNLVTALALGAMALRDQSETYTEQEQDEDDDDDNNTTAAATADIDTATTAVATGTATADATAAAEDTESGTTGATVETEEGSSAAATDDQHAAAVAAAEVAEVAEAAVSDEQVIATLAFMTSIAQLIVALQQYVELDEAREIKQLENCTSLEEDLREIEHACTTPAALKPFTKLQTVLTQWYPAGDADDSSDHDDEDTMEQ